MSPRIAKYPPLSGVGFDRHQAVPPSMPPPPPTGPNPSPVPSNNWSVVVASLTAAAIYGKWTGPIATEGMGDILWQYDWGPGQVHIPAGPALLTPSIGLLVLGSSTKYFLPSFAVQEKATGGPAAAGSFVPVAICGACGAVPTQDCWDAGGVGFVYPSSVCFEMVSQRWVGFNFFDELVGFIGMGVDAASSMVLSKFANKMVPNSLAGSGIAGAVIRGVLKTAIKKGIGLVGMNKYGRVGEAGLAVAAVEADVPVGSALAVPAAAKLVDGLAMKMGEAWGSQPGDSGVVPSSTQDAAGTGVQPAASAPPQDAGNAAGYPGAADAGGGGGDGGSGPVDAGVPPAAGVPPQDAGSEGGYPGADPTGGGEGDGGSGTSPVDAGVQPEAGAPPQDAGNVAGYPGAADAGGGEGDGGSGPVDAGVPPAAGVPPEDAGDAGGYPGADPDGGSGGEGGGGGGG